MCSICLAQGEPNSSTYCLAEKLTTFLLEHPTHHSLVILTDFPWASMGLEAATDFINLLVSTTGNICARHHSHPSFCPCKFVCLKLYHDRLDLGNLVDKEALEWNREKFDKTHRLLGSMDPPTEYGSKLAFPDLQPIYGRDSMEELFDNNNMPTPEFLRRVRSFDGDLIHRHFRGT